MFGTSLGFAPKISFTSDCGRTCANPNLEPQQW